MDPSLPPAIERYVSAHEQRLTRAWPLVAAGFGAAAVFLLVLAAGKMTHRPMDRWIMEDWVGWGAALAFVAIAVGAGAVFALRVRRQIPAPRRALSRPASVLWIYPIEVSVNGIPSARLVGLAMDDGTEVRLNVEPGERNAAVAELRRHVPHSIVGYGEAQAKLYQQRVAAAESRSRGSVRTG